MSYFGQDLSLMVDGKPLAGGFRTSNVLVRAVIISLFTWRRALPDDELPGSERMGWWADSYADATGDRIGSRLWLLARETITTRTIERARQYCIEALTWLIEDGVATSVDVQIERLGVSGIGILVTIYRSGRQPTVLRFGEVWSFLKNV